MLTEELNELLTRTSKGTPMGDLFRRFWLPALLSEEIREPDCPPVRVSLLGESLVAFRDSAGRVGLLDAHCPHRRADLFFGRNEQGGLRCVYHGWKFNVEGECLDMPSEPPGSALKSRISAVSYPAVEQGGIVWAYIGPKDRRAEIPDLEFLRVPESHRYVSKCLMNCNFQQAVEGSIDTAHLSFLHREIDPADDRPDVFGVGELQQYSEQDGAPRFFVKDTDYGLLIAARRDAEHDTYYWRISQWFFPAYVFVPTAADLVRRANLFIPINDESCWWYRVRWHPERSLSEAEINGYRFSGLDYAELIPGTYRPRGHKGNDYLIDRSAQRISSFTGIRSAQLQDIAIQESQGAIVDRAKEHLGTSDTAITRCRRRLLEAARALQKGVEPPAATRGGAYRALAVAMCLKRDISFEEGSKEYIASRV